MLDDTELYEDLIERASGLDTDFWEPIYSLHKSLVVSLIAGYCAMNKRQDITDEELAAALKGAAEDAERDFILGWDKVIGPAIEREIPKRIEEALEEDMKYRKDPSHVVYCLKITREDVRRVAWAKRITIMESEDFWTQIEHYLVSHSNQLNWSEAVEEALEGIV